MGGLQAAFFFNPTSWIGVEIVFFPAHSPMMKIILEA